MPEPGDPFSILLRNLILGGSLFAAGVGAWLSVLNVRDVLAGRPWAWAYACARIGSVLIIVPVATLLLRVPEVELSWASGIYGLGIVLAGVGLVGVALEHRERWRRGERGHRGPLQ